MQEGGSAPCRRSGRKLSDKEFSLWLGPLPPARTAEWIGNALLERSIFTMTDVYIPPQKHYAFVRFRSKEGALRALETFRVNPLFLDGVQVGVAAAFDEKRNYVQLAGHSVKIRNLEACTTQQLEGVLAQMAITTYVDACIPNDQMYGFVRFGTKAEAERFLRQGPCLGLNGKPLEMELCKPRRRKPVAKAKAA